MKLKEKFITTCVTVLMCTLMVLTPTFAASEFDKGTGTVYVPTDKTMVVAKTDVKRSLMYSYVMTKANSVYPNTAKQYIEDTYKRCYIQWYTKNGTAITEKVKLSEGVLREIHLKEGYMNSNNITLKISGHHADYDAYVAYYYNGK